jgi:multidrug efflux pump subunit AcrB
MIGIVKLALRRPYTFIVMALLIMIFGVASALRTPPDIFPNIDIPAISVVFSYTGLSPDDMAGRVVTFYERSLTTSVNAIEHIESQSIPNYGIIKVFMAARSGRSRRTSTNRRCTPTASTQTTSSTPCRSKT